MWYLPYLTLPLEERTNKRGRINYVGNRMIVTATIRSIRKKLVQMEINVSIGCILRLQPFFITYATEKEMSLSLQNMFKHKNDVRHLDDSGKEGWMKHSSLSHHSSWQDVPAPKYKMGIMLGRAR